MVWVGYESRAFGWSTMDSIFLGPSCPSPQPPHRESVGELGKTKERFGATDLRHPDHRGYLAIR